MRNPNAKTIGLINPAQLTRVLSRRSIGKLVNLERLHLHNMSLKGQVPKSLCNLVKLEELKACGNELTNAPPSLMVGRHGYRKTSRSDNCLPLYLACLRAGVPYPSTSLHLYA